MKMNFKYVSMMACAAMMAAFTSCSNDDADVPNLIEEGAEARLSFSFTLPQSAATRADDGDGIDGVGKENTIKSVQVFIFKADGTAADGNGTEFDDIDNQFSKNTTTGVYTLKEANRIKTTSGQKKIYIAANVSSTAATEDALKAEKVLWTNLVQSDAIAMCSQVISKSLVAQEENTSEATVNTAKGTLERLVSKVAVSTSNTTFTQTLGEGSDNELTINYEVQQWAVGQVNQSVFLAQNISDTDVLITPQDTRTAAPAKADFMAVNGTFASDAALSAATNFAYVGENAPENGTYGEATYAMIRTQAKPQKSASVDATTGKIKWNNTAITGDFWYVYDKNGMYFCASETDANAVGTKLVAPVYMKKFTGGYVYYLVTLNESKTGKEGAIYRNQFVHVTVNGIVDNTFGGMPGKDDGETPPDPKDEDPDIFDPEEPIIEKNAYLLIDVSVAPWTYSGETVELQ